MDRTNSIQPQHKKTFYLLLLFGGLVGLLTALTPPVWIIVVAGGLIGTAVLVYLSCKYPEFFLILALFTNFMKGLFIPGIAVGEFGIVPYMLFTVLAFVGYGYQTLMGKRRLLMPVGYEFLLLFIGITTISLLTVQNFRVAVGLYARTVILWMLFFLLVQMLVDKKSVERLIKFLLIQAVLVVGWGIFSGVQLNYFGLMERESFFWTQFQKNDFSTYLALVLMLALATLMVNARRGERLMALILIPMIPVAWMFTFSRGGLLSILISLGVFVLLIRSRIMLRRLWGWIGVFVILAVIGVASLPSNARILAIDGVRSIINPSEAKIERNKKTVDIRLEVAEIAIEVIGENPLLGVGFNQWQFYSPIKVRRYEAQTGEYIETGFSVHNRYLGIAVNSGLAALASYLAFLFILLLYGVTIQFTTRNQFLRIYLAALLAALIGIQISLQLTPSILWEWPVFGIIAGLINVIELDMRGRLPQKRSVKFKTITRSASTMSSN